MMDINNLLRDNIRKLVPYSTARSEFKSVAEIYMDANENNFPHTHHRYPDPYQMSLKNAVAEWKSVSTDHIFIGHGSDEIIDLVIRAFCNPGTDAVVALEPTYGMYAVSAAINDVKYRRYLLDREFEFEADALIRFFAPGDKVLFICTPNNPTGNAFPAEKLEKVITSFPGIVVLDEAYIDFAQTPSFISRINEFPNLIVMQTLSKSMAAAGLRIGLSFMNPDIVNIFNRIKPPYNISGVAINEAVTRVTRRDQVLPQIEILKVQRDSFLIWLTTLPYVVKVYPSQANFVLVKVEKPDVLYLHLIGKGIVVRDRSGQYQCEGCLRISIGLPSEMERLKEVLVNFRQENSL